MVSTIHRVLQFTTAQFTILNILADDRLAWLRGTPMQTEYGNGGDTLVIVWAHEWAREVVAHAKSS